MIINCDYCGSSIDTNKYKICPFCGANYNEDQELIENKKREKELKDLKIEQQKLKNEREKIQLKKESKKQKSSFFSFILYITLFGILPISLMFLIIKGPMISNNKENTNIESIYEENINDNENILEEEHITVNINESAQLSNFKVTVTELKKVDKGNWIEADDGYMYVGFNFIVENTSNKELKLATEDVYCLVNDILCEGFLYSKEKYLQSSYVPAGMKIAGYACFEVPIDSKNFTLKYGEYITINVINDLKN